MSYKFFWLTQTYTWHPACHMEHHHLIHPAAPAVLHRDSAVQHKLPCLRGSPIAGDEEVMTPIAVWIAVIRA